MAPGAGEVGEIEVETPGGAVEQAEDGGVVGEVGDLVYLTEKLGVGALAAGGKGVGTAVSPMNTLAGWKL